MTWQMAQDIGFFTVQMTRQIFHPDVPEDEFQEVIDEFALVIERTEGPDEHVTSFLTKTLRRNPPPTPPPDEDIEWFARQADRFAHLAPVILRFDPLADTLSNRSHIWDAARGALKSSIDWPQVAGW
jgi:hypothetical protein